MQGESHLGACANFNALAFDPESIHRQSPKFSSGFNPSYPVLHAVLMCDVRVQPKFATTIFLLGWSSLQSEMHLYTQVRFSQAYPNHGTYKLVLFGFYTRTASMQQDEYVVLDHNEPLTFAEPKALLWVSGESSQAGLAIGDNRSSVVKVQ